MFALNKADLGSIRSILYSSQNPPGVITKVETGAITEYDPKTKGIANASDPASAV